MLNNMIFSVACVLALEVSTMSQAEAQLFRRLRTMTHQVQPRYENGHWGYPDERFDDANLTKLRIHLAGYPHYVRTDGLSNNQVYSLRDSLHASDIFRDVVKTQIPVPVPVTVARPTIQAKPMETPKPERIETPKETSFWR